MLLVMKQNEATAERTRIFISRRTSDSKHCRAQGYAGRSRAICASTTALCANCPPIRCCTTYPARCATPATRESIRPRCASPQLLAWADPVGEMLGISPPGLAHRPGGRSARRQSACFEGMQPYAARYGGHQFGQWAGQLGDGRAITLCEVVSADGKRYDLQLKGAGRTPYARFADGRAVLRSSVREFMCSEAMHHLGVPTTRALSLVATGESVVRDMFYDGHPRAEPGAVVCRVAPSFVRFGNFEILTAHNELDALKRLADYVIVKHFPELGEPSAATYARWFEEICRRTALMVTEWTRVGFVHGVMNTDNMSILGLTIDYGPYGWLEGYDLRWTPNTTDAQDGATALAINRRSRFGIWRGSRMRSHRWSRTERRLNRGWRFLAKRSSAASSRMLADKLGLASLDREGDGQLLTDLFELLQQVETDMTLFFRSLAALPVDGVADTADDSALIEPLRRAFYAEDAFAPDTP